VSDCRFVTEVYSIKKNLIKIYEEIGAKVKIKLRTENEY
jgi:hypothetical protein